MIRSQEKIKEIIDKHNQRSNESCVHSSVEMVLKLLGKVNLDYYALQDGKSAGSFGEYNGKQINGVKFSQIKLAKRGPTFPFDSLFEIIEKELKSNKYVIVTFIGDTEDGRRYHAYVVYDQDNNQNDFLTVTKASQNGTYITQFNRNIKAEIRSSNGTDILVYTITDS